MFLFKLNLLLAENQLSSVRSSSTIDVKVLHLLNDLTSRSDKLAEKLFQITFNTSQFVKNTAKCRESNIEKKLDDLVNSKGFNVTSSSTSKFQIVVENFAKLCKITVISPQHATTDTVHIKNTLFLNAFYDYLLNLIKVM
jgi:hypothetical protein